GGEGVPLRHRRRHTRARGAVRGTLAAGRLPLHVRARLHGWLSGLLVDADSFNGVLPHLTANDVTMICVSRAPLEKLLAYRERMGWRFNWASSASDFHFDYGVSAGVSPTHDPAAPVLEANELGLLKLLNEQPAVRESLPQIAGRNASASGTDLE